MWAELDGPVGGTVGGSDYCVFILELSLGVLEPQLSLPHSHIVLLDVVYAAIAQGGTLQAAQTVSHTQQTSIIYNSYHPIYAFLLNQEIYPLAHLGKEKRMRYHWL